VEAVHGNQPRDNARPFISYKECPMSHPAIYRNPPRLAVIYAILLFVLIATCIYNGENDLPFTIVLLLVSSPLLLFALYRLLASLLRRAKVFDDRICYRCLS